MLFYTVYSEEFVQLKKKNNLNLQSKAHTHVLKPFTNMYETVFTYYCADETIA